MTDTFESRRHKEGVAFLAVKFMRVALAFHGIAGDFHLLHANGMLPGSGLTDRLRELTESLAFDLKEKAHALFRRGPSADLAPTGEPPDMHQILAGMKTSMERRTIDSYVGTGYHLLQILQEALYQVERYAPELRLEKDEIKRLLSLARASSYKFSPEEQEELDRLRNVEEISSTLARDSVELAQRIMIRCERIMSRTKEVMRRFMAGGGDNEILVLNLLENMTLVDDVYGPGAAEDVFRDLCPGTEGTGVERALALVRARCGNVTAVASISS